MLKISWSFLKEFSVPFKSFDVSKVDDTIRFLETLVIYLAGKREKSALHPDSVSCVFNKLHYKT